MIALFAAVIADDPSGVRGEEGDLVATVEAQLAYLRRVQGSPDTRRAVLDAMIERRRTSTTLRPFEMVVRPDGGESARLPRELLLRAQDLELPSVKEVLTEARFQPRVVEQLESRVAVLTPQGNGGSWDINRLFRELRQAGASVSFNYVIPTQVVIKGPDGPGLPLSLEPPDLQKEEVAQQERASVRVVLIDTGIAERQRPDGWLARVERTGENIDTLSDVNPDLLDLGAGHGTFCAGIVQQVAPSVPIKVFKALDSEGIGAELDVAIQMVAAARQGIEARQHVVINVSLGVESVDDSTPIALDAALDIIKEEQVRADSEVLVVAAAGNSGDNHRKTYPAALRDVVAVAALTPTLAGADWSSRGPWVDVSTVGEGVLSTFVPGKESELPESVGPADEFTAESPWAVWSGTSFASPQVAGRIAEMANKQGIRPSQALKALVDGETYLKGFGRTVRILDGA